MPPAMEKNGGYLHIINSHRDIKETLTDLCLVLDLDETLVSTSELPIQTLTNLGIFSKTTPQTLALRPRIYTFQLYDVGEKVGTGTKNKTWGILRPHVEEFLRFCFGYFKVVTVWSAGIEKYVDQIVNIAFKNNRPYLIYHRDYCEYFPPGKGGQNSKFLIKPLTKMMNDPVLSQYMTPKNTFILDDNAKTATLNKGNLINIPEYSPQADIESFLADDRALLQLRDWLLTPEVMESQDVRELDKSQIFIEIIEESSPQDEGILIR